MLAFNSTDYKDNEHGHAITILGYDSTDLYYYDNSNGITEDLIFKAVLSLYKHNKQLLIDSGFNKLISYLYNMNISKEAINQSI